jgi:uncharacterized protein (TIGR02466 family)
VDQGSLVMQNVPIIYDMYWKENFPNEVEHIHNSCLGIVQNDVTGGRRVSNVGGYQSWDNIHTMDAFKSLVNIIQTQFKQFHAELDLVDQVEFEINNMWININPPGSHNKLHRHVNPPSLDRITSSCILSGTYYVYVPENSGDLVFHNGREDYSHMTHEPAIVRIPEIFLKNYKNMHIRPLYRVKPKAGDLLLWFSDLIHGVEHNKSEENRISISFNLGLKLK